MRNPLAQKECDHCRRKDLGSKAAGLARVVINILNPYNHEEIISRVWLDVCNPTVRYRPRCKALVELFGHTQQCPVCFEYNPPGAELRVYHTTGRWAA